jgi:glutamate racemase
LDSRPIGVFDSGIGGLTVLKEIVKILPSEDIIYFGDTARVPYGNKSLETVTKFALQNARFLLSRDVKAIVIACNTASAFSIETVQKSFDVPVMGVISPGAHAAIRATQNGKIGIIATEGTIASRAYERAIRRGYPDAEIFGQPCPLFVPIVEEGWSGKKASYLIAEEYLQSLRDAMVDTVVMGCTHYPLLREVIEEIMGEGVSLINPGEETAMDLKEILVERGLQSGKREKTTYKYYVSDNPGKFSKVGNNFLNSEIVNIEKIDIEEY